MMSKLTIEDSENVTVGPEDVQALIEATRVVDVRLDEVHAGPVGAISPDLVVEVEVDEPQIGRVDEPDMILVRLTHQVTCRPAGGTDIATHIRVSHVVTLEAAERLTTRMAVVAAWVETNLYFLVYPYVRQTVQTLTTSLGMPAVVLGYLNRDERPITGSQTGNSQA